MMPLAYAFTLWVLPTILGVFIVIMRRDLTAAEYVGLLALAFLVPLLGTAAVIFYVAFVVPRLRR
jgi:hypothetical protein